MKKDVHFFPLSHQIVFMNILQSYDYFYKIEKFKKTYYIIFKIYIGQLKNHQCFRMEHFKAQKFENYI